MYTHYTYKIIIMNNNILHQNNIQLHCYFKIIESTIFQYYPEFSKYLFQLMNN